jgi:hypothetical protein
MVTFGRKSFSNQFEGKNDDKEPKHKLPTETELPGIFNMLSLSAPLKCLPSFLGLSP